MDRALRPLLHFPAVFSPPTCSLMSQASRRDLSVSSKVLASNRPNKSSRGATKARPSRLVAGTKPGAVITVEVFMEEDQIAPVRSSSSTADFSLLAFVVRNPG
jgi:hypothetical protein